MATADPSASFRLSHFEIHVRDVRGMERFYTRVLGFVVTDRGAAPDGLVFLSRHPDGHHQIVLNPMPSRGGRGNRLDHISFRVSTLAALRNVHAALLLDAGAEVEAVSHGTTWSVYFRDPEGNRLEVFADTPWHVEQPCRFVVDLALSDAELHALTEKKIRDLPGFMLIEDWQRAHRMAVAAGSKQPKPS